MDDLPVSRINQYLYCPRRFWLIYVEQTMIVSAEVLDGILKHEHVHEATSHSGRITALPVYSERLRLTGTLDAIEQTRDGLMIIEHKRGSTREYINDQVQVAAQAIAYEEMTGQTVVLGSVFSWESRRRVQFNISPELRQLVEQTVMQMHQIIAQGKRPPPTTETHKCKGCSLREACQPALFRKLHGKGNRQ
jgi:CRISPR-associated exonuclease Cas4